MTTFVTLELGLKALKRHSTVWGHQGGNMFEESLSRLWPSSKQKRSDATEDDKKALRAHIEALFEDFK